MQMLITMALTVGLMLALPAQDEGFVPLFDGRTLDGWVNVNCAPDTFTARDGVIAVSGAPICEIRTPRMYENFVLELEYQHQKPMGNAGVFVWADALPARGQPFLRAIEVQVLDGRNSDTYTSHGDVFAIHGAVLTPDRPHPKGAMRSLPSEWRAKGPGEWNHYRITGNNGTLKLAVNGKEVSGGYDISPRKGYIALESEGAPTLFRNVRIKELPPSPTPLTAAQVATADAGHRALYDGQSFTNWLVPPAQRDRWRVHDWRIAHPGGSAAAASEALVSAEEYGDIELIADWRLVEGDAPAPKGPGIAQLTRRDLRAVVAPLGVPVRPAGEWNRVVQRLVGNRVTASINGEVTVDEIVPDLPRRGRIGLVPLDRNVEFANVFVKALP